MSTVFLPIYQQYVYSIPPYLFSTFTVKFLPISAVHLQYSSLSQHYIYSTVQYSLFQQYISSIPPYLRSTSTVILPISAVLHVYIIPPYCSSTSCLQYSSYSQQYNMYIVQYSYLSQQGLSTLLLSLSSIQSIQYSWQVQVKGQCWEPKTGQQKVHLYYEDDPLCPSSYIIYMFPANCIYIRILGLMTCYSLPKKSQPKLQMQKFKEKQKKNLTETLEFWEMLTAAGTLVVAYTYNIVLYTV